MSLKIAEKEVSQFKCCEKQVDTATILDKNISYGNEFPGWETIWTGSQEFTQSGSFSLSGVSSSDVIRICALAEFSIYNYDPVYGNETYDTDFIPLTEQELPVSIYSGSGRIEFTHNSGQILFTFVPYEMSFKGNVNRVTPVKVTFTTVRRKI